MSLRVRNLPCIKAVPEEFIDPTINALVGYDLALIPLLHDPEQLDAKITETIGVLQDDPELGVNLEISQPVRNPYMIQPTKRDDAKLRAEVDRIDPMDLNEVMKILLAVSPDVLQRCLDNKSYLASRYNIAKKEVIRCQQTKQQSLYSADGGSPKKPSASVLTAQNDANITPSPSSVGAYSADLRSFACLPVHNIIAHLNGENGDEILHHLGVIRCDPKEAAATATWTQSVLAKPLLTRKEEIADQMVDKLEVNLKRTGQLLT